MTSALPDVAVLSVGADIEPFTREIELSGLVWSDRAVPWPVTARALVIVAAPKQLGVVRDLVDAARALIIDSGARILLAVPRSDVAVYDDWISRSIRLDLSTTGTLHAAYVAVRIDDPRGIANELSRIAPQRLPLTPFNCQRSDLPEGVLRLVSRAFNDCVSVELTDLMPGATASVFRVEAQGQLGQRPLPFFAKVAPRQRVIEEFDNFVSHVRDFVPFNARPSLVLERCLVGEANGILVGRFIEDSEPLIDSVLRGSPNAAIHGVFESLLRGWWRRGDHAKTVADRVVTSSLGHWYSPRSNTRQATLRTHCEAVGAACDPLNLAAGLEARSRSPHLRSLIHGDLHARNIQVRNGEVFLIDFGSIQDGPILADPALLEASLMLEVGVACIKKGDSAIWRDTVLQRLFVPGWDSHRHLLDLSGDRNPRIAGLCTAVRIIRMHALAAELSDGDYRAMMIAALLRVACFDTPDPAERSEVAAVLCRVAADLAS